MPEKDSYIDLLDQSFSDSALSIKTGLDMPCLELTSSVLIDCTEKLKTDESFLFTQLTDITGVDYLHYGLSEWKTEAATDTGYSRAVSKEPQPIWQGPRFAVVYHLLSIKHNRRLRLRVRLEEENITVPSVCAVWPSANWYEREIFDLFGINFSGHPDLRRLLTDYNFEGHPFRKDFPLEGEVEIRYDAARQSCVYDPVSIKNRVVVPRVIRNDNRYELEEDQKELSEGDNNG